MKKKVLLILIPIVVIIGGILGAYFYVNKTIYRPTKNEDIFTTKEQEQKSEYVEEHGVFNILLCGLDGRKTDSGSRTDSMIVGTIDTTKKKVKLVSFMRDMYVPIPGHGQSRINSAFAIGGPELLMKTLNEDFNINVQYYMTIDFKAFQALVDKMNGIDIDVKDYELDQLNYYIKEANWNNPHYIKKAGYQHLDGQQALSYCRIRKVGNNDYERTERQRKVLALLISKAKKASLLKLPQLFTTLLPYIKTNIPTGKLANIGYTVLRFGSTPVETARIPADGMFKGMVINGADVLVPDIEKNVAFLDNFITSTGSIGEGNAPAYMANNFHADDTAIDKRNVKRNTVKIIIPKKSKESHTFDQVKKSSGSDDTTTISIDENGESDQGASIDTSSKIDEGNTKDSNSNGKKPNSPKPSKTTPEKNNGSSNNIEDKGNNGDTNNSSNTETNPVQSENGNDTTNSTTESGISN